MIPLFLQTLLLTAAAYFVGAAVACLVRRTFYVPARLEPAPARPVVPLPDIAPRVAGAGRFGVAERAPLPTPAVEPPAAAAAIEPAPAEDLKRIRTIDTELEARLNALGIRRYEDIAAWMQPHIERIGKALGLGDRISRENWIEQAQVLAKGGLTHYAARAARGEIANAAPTPDEGGPPRAAVPVSPVPPPAPAPRVPTIAALAPAAEVALAVPVIYSPPEVSERAAFAAPRHEEPAPGPAAAVPMRPAVPATRDNLQRISGVDAEVEAALGAQGIARYSQIAHWSPADVTRFESQLGAAGRIGRENWIEQAQILSRGGDTAYSRDYDRRMRGDAVAAALLPTQLAEAIDANSNATAGETPAPARSDLGTFRSVRSAAYQTTTGTTSDTGSRASAQSKQLRPAQPEDLKRIRGIGVLIEKKLNQLGVSGYEQIANWTAQDIDRVSQSLDFKGRIERENWVEQARILASGGATEFSRRVDRGEVETSRYRP